MVAHQFDPGHKTEIKQFTFVSDYYVHFILGESSLEEYAKEYFGSDQGAGAAARSKLDDAERHLKVVLKDNGKVCNVFQVKEIRNSILLLFC